MDYSVERKRLVAWLKDQLVGTALDNETLHDIHPLDRYPTGILFPITSGKDEQDLTVSNEEHDDSVGIEGEEPQGGNVESTTKHNLYTPPSSVGFSFFTDSPVLQFKILCAAVQYKRNGEGDEKERFINIRYKRIKLGEEHNAPQPLEVRLSRGHEAFHKYYDVFEKRARVHVFRKPFLDGGIVTVSIVNQQKTKGTKKQELNEKSLFEVELGCSLDTGKVGIWPYVDKNLLTAEEQELEVQYKHNYVYAVGHGAAVDWTDEQGVVKKIRTDFLPTVEVPQVAADITGDGNPALCLARLAGRKNEEGLPDDVVEELGRFVKDYSAWILEKQKEAKALKIDEQEAALRISNRMVTALRRMQRGVSLLRRGGSDPHVAEAFKLANQAMLDQMRQADRVLGKPREESDYKWHSFQLAFLLTILESVINEDDDFRDTVDLIWFPTGGGKTEAYLGLIAFLIMWRRFKYPESGGGTTVIMRYTLRLLTSQQYLRASRLICALELMRRRTPKLGDEPITVGMWIGSQTSPNYFKQAMEYVQQAKEGTESSLKKLVLDECPWCGTPYQASHNYVSELDTFHFLCTNVKCEFGGEGENNIPCNVVDEALYNKPPTLLVATVDKFARLAWVEQTNAFFNRNSNRPPELVIQDELHLIAGPLGSIAGLYEAALDTVLVQRGVHPKYIASTATIRNAEQQVKKLYGRELAVFPPPGLVYGDSYFARTVPLDKRPGRLYIGYLAPMLNRKRCIAPLTAALHVAPEALFYGKKEDQDDLLEAWWTQVVFHGSLKSVGDNHTTFLTDVKDAVRRLQGEQKQFDNGEVVGFSPRSDARIAQLTSISSAERNAQTFSCLNQKRNEDGCLDVVLATNMVSVGLDVSRLSLMIINGQPSTTAEYIQTSSRVGRSDVPGLVFVNFYRDQARSLSHYENFRPYHDSFYRFVESTSVTPYTHQARTRALSAALVIAIRHSCETLLGNNKAGSFNPVDDKVQKVIESLKQRCNRADPDHGAETANHIDRLVKQWEKEAKHCTAYRVQLGYEVTDNDKVISGLLRNYGDRTDGLWPTPQSMRNVENMATLKPI